MLPIDFFCNVLEIELLPWQAECLKRIYGDQKVPIINEFYFSAPKKQGKTWFFGGGLSLYHILLQPEVKNALALTVASSKEQACLTYDSTVDMIRNSSQLTELVESKRLEVFADNLVFHGKDGDRMYQVVPNEPKTIHGKRPTFTNIDELQTFVGSKAAEIVDTMVISQRQCLHPLILYTSHAGADLNSIAAEKEKLIDKYEQGVLKQPSGFDYKIYRASSKHEWDSFEAFKEANPSHPILISEATHKREVEIARQTPNLQRTYRCFVLNQWVSKSSSLINLEDWKACYEDYSEEDLLGRPAYAAFDASVYDDLTAFMLVFPPTEEEIAEASESNKQPSYRSLTHAFIPEGRLREKELRDQVPYWEWHEQGYLHLTPGSVIDEDFVIQTILDQAKKFDIREMAYDQHRAQHIVKRLDEAGLTTVEHRTGMIFMSEPTAQFVKHVIGHTLHHNGNPLLSWNVGNVQARTDQVGNIAPQKGKRTEKIDCAFALILALGRAITREEKQFASFWDTGISTFRSMYDEPLEGEAEEGVSKNAEQ